MATNLWESLYAQAPPNSVTQQSSNFQTLPAWFQDYQKAMLQYAAQSTPANMPLYQGNRQSDLSNPATAARVQASFSPQERQAFGQVSGMQGQFQPWINQAHEMTANAGNVGAASGINNYMNPYIDDVNHNLATLAGRNLSENLLPQLSDNFVAAGQMSGTRLGEFQSRAVRDTQESLLRQQSENLRQGYNTALSGSQADLDRQMTGGAQVNNLAGSAQQYGLTDVGALASVGQEVGAKAQQGSDIAYGDWQNQLDWPLRNISTLNSALRGTTVPTSSTSYGQNYSGGFQPSPLTSLASAGYLAAGYKKGGRVKGALRKMAVGGQWEDAPLVGSGVTGPGRQGPMAWYDRGAPPTGAQAPAGVGGGPPTPPAQQVPAGPTAPTLPPQANPRAMQAIQQRPFNMGVGGGAHVPAQQYPHPGMGMGPPQGPPQGMPGAWGAGPPGALRRRFAA